MIIRKFKVKIIDDFKNQWLKDTATKENITVEEAIKYYGVMLAVLDKRIAGQIVTITEQYYTQDNVTDFF